MDLTAAPHRAFVLVAKHASFTRAAAELNISQPALSAVIRELERRLGFSLFERTSRRVELTWEGRAFLVNVQRVVLEVDWIAQRSKEILRNDLRLAVQTYSVLIDERVQLTDNFAAANPDVDMQIVQYGGDRVYDVVRRHDADIAIGIEPADRQEQSPLNPALGSELEPLTLARRQMGLFVPTRHPLARLDAIPEERLKGVPIARTGRVHGGSLASAINRYLDGVGAQAIRIPEGDAFSIIRYAAAQGVPAVDIGWFAPLAVPQRSDLVRKPISGTSLTTELVAVRQRRAQRPALSGSGDTPRRKPDDADRVLLVGWSPGCLTLSVMDGLVPSIHAVGRLYARRSDKD